jgi:hypothetical protein
LFVLDLGKQYVIQRVIDFAHFLSNDGKAQDSLAGIEAGTTFSTELSTGVVERLQERNRA